ncbi:hypothetical protein [Magnetospirillum molischianum]|uniref:Uncharacterized protein n=1 Tax=Magnetospirillum molischianum DSM 120 TaxID=1150626 RepID=H8FV97_MAGML|nr:hypothetical protein [Magnetospirillum molischianum]CCG42285.1 membrane hypothetical protein [Magnetospirillum molischianum DSM 120]
MNRSSDLGRILMIGGLCLFVAFTYFGFAPPYHHVFELLAKARDPNLFPADPFLNDPGAFGPSLFYPLVRLIGLPLGNDIFGLTLHLTAGALILSAAVVVVRRRLTGGDDAAALLTVLIGCFFSAKLLAGVHAAPIPLHAPTPEGIAHLFGMAALLAGLDRRPALAALAAALCVTASPEGNILIALAAPLWLALDRSLPRYSVLWGLLPLGAVALMLRVVAALPPQGFGGGVAMAGQTPLAAILLILACVWVIRQGRKPDGDPTLRAWFWVLAGLTLVAGTVLLVLSFIPSLPPIPLVSVLSLPLASAYPTWLILTVAVARIAVSTRLAGLEKLLLFTALLVLTPSPVAVGFAVALALFARFLLLVREKLGCGIGVRLAPASTLVPVLLLMLLVRSGTELASPVWIDRIAFGHSSRWSAGVFANESTWAAWEALAPLPDFPLVALYDNLAYQVVDLKAAALPGALEVHSAANFAAGKSPFLAPPRFVSADPDLEREAALREAVIVELVHTLGRGESLSSEPVGLVRLGNDRPVINIPVSLETFLSQRRMAVLVPPGLARLFPAALPRRAFGEQVLIGFGIVP